MDKPLIIECIGVLIGGAVGFILLYQGIDFVLCGMISMSIVFISTMLAYKVHCNIKRTYNIEQFRKWCKTQGDK